jgi:hypothetical protein
LELETSDEELLKRPLVEPISPLETSLKSNATDQYRVMVVMRRVGQKIDRLLESAESSLGSSLLGRLGAIREIMVSELLPAEQKLLVSLLFMPAVRQLSRSSSEIELLLGRFPDYLMNPDSAEIALNGGGIGVGSTARTGAALIHRGFGAQVTGPRQSPLPNYPFPK